MKKILLATTMLAAFAGYADADVSVSGDARMGVKYDGADSQFSSRMRIKFSGSGTTDGGLSFGGSFRAADAVGAGSGTKGSTFISGAFGKITMGDTGNAADAVVGQVSAVGYTGLGSHNEITWLSKDVTGALYEYSAGAVSFAAGSGQLNGAHDFTSAAVKYSAGDVSVAVGYENNNDDGTQMSAMVSANMSGATLKAKVAQADGYDAEYALSVDYKMDVTTVTGFYSHDYEDQDHYGVGVSYDLGGGASIIGGLVDGDSLDATNFDLGVSMSF